MSIDLNPQRSRRRSYGRGALVGGLGLGGLAAFGYLVDSFLRPERLDPIRVELQAILLTALGGAVTGLVYGVTGHEFRALGRHGQSLQAGFTALTYFLLLFSLVAIEDGGEVPWSLTAALFASLVVLFAVCLAWARRRERLASAPPQVPRSTT